MLRSRLEGVQGWLSFEGWGEYPLFSTKQGAGRAALLGTGLGCCLGLHAGGFIALSAWQLFGTISPRIFLAWQWCAFATVHSIFHLLEYFTTALCNPTVASSDSFLVNHSTAYTAATLTSWTEFLLRFTFRPTWNVPSSVAFVGLGVVFVGQFIRSAAMITAGQSFNHLIQTYKKENHVLVTHGVYSILRHPSYVGWFYWSIGTQLVLGNVLHATLFAFVSWNFFNRRIPFEEESLCAHFPEEYPKYMRKTWMGIPFLKSNIPSRASNHKQQ